LQASWQKWVPLTGILFVILFIIGGILATGPDNTDNDQHVVEWYADSGNQTATIAGAYILAVAGGAMLLFINRLRSVVADAEGAKPIFAPFILGGGVVYIAALAVAAAAFGAISGGVKFGTDPAVQSAELIRALNSMGFAAILIFGMFPLIFAMFTTAIASMRYKIFASWFNWLTIVCGIILFFAAAFFPMIALGIWLIAASLQLMKHQPGATAAA
jgi:hypothetical protein